MPFGLDNVPSVIQVFISEPLLWLCSAGYNLSHSERHISLYFLSFLNLSVLSSTITSDLHLTFYMHLTFIRWRNNVQSES